MYSIVISKLSLSSLTDRTVNISSFTLLPIATNFFNNVFKYIMNPASVWAHGLVAMKKLANTALTQQRSRVRISLGPDFLGRFIYKICLTYKIWLY